MNIFYVFFKFFLRLERLKCFYNVNRFNESYINYNKKNNINISYILKIKFFENKLFLKH